jgi:hypothetical protein
MFDTLTSSIPQCTDQICKMMCSNVTPLQLHSYAFSGELHKK